MVFMSRTYLHTPNDSAFRSHYGVIFISFFGMHLNFGTIAQTLSLFLIFQNCMISIPAAIIDRFSSNHQP